MENYNHILVHLDVGAMPLLDIWLNEISKEHCLILVKLHVAAMLLLDILLNDIIKNHSQILAQVSCGRNATP